MSLLKIIGVEHKSGSFTSEGKTVEYNNIYLYAVRSLSKPSDGRLCFGEVTETVKVKYNNDVIRNIFGFDMTSDDFVSMIGSEYNVFYDKNGSVEKVSAVASASSGKKGA